MKHAFVPFTFAVAAGAVAAIATPASAQLAQSGAVDWVRQDPTLLAL